MEVDNVSTGRNGNVRGPRKQALTVGGDVAPHGSCDGAARARSTEDQSSETPGTDHLIALGVRSHALLQEYRRLFNNISRLCASSERVGEVDKAKLLALESHIRRIASASSYGTELTTQLEMHVREPSADLRRVNLCRAVDESVAEIDYLLGDRVRLDVRHYLSSALVRPRFKLVCATPQALHRVITTLVVRGVERMPGGGRLTMITACEQDVTSRPTTDTQQQGASRRRIKGRRPSRPVRFPSKGGTPLAPPGWVSLRVLDTPTPARDALPDDSPSIRGALRAAARTVRGFGGHLEFIRKDERVAGVRVLLPVA